MSVMCCAIPSFLIGLELRGRPELAGRPLALLGPDETVCAASREARESGVLPGLRPRQAQARCPDVLLRPIDALARQAEQDAFLGALAGWGLPVEERGWGAAYMDLRPVAHEARLVQPLCADMGRALRGAWGEALAPRIGWDSGKFTAYAAASTTRPGQMRLVDGADEARFLNPLPVALLPLPPLALQQLGWLGVATLGLFAKLPAVAVWQRFGSPGKLAHRLAQGKDDRPVRATVGAPLDAVEVDFDAPTERVDLATERALVALRPRFAALAEGAQGCRGVRLALRFLDRGAREVDCAFVQPVNPVAWPESAARLRESLARSLASFAWPAPLVALRATLSGLAELAPEQLSLFGDLDDLGAMGARGEADAGLDAERQALVRAFAPRYGAATFLRAERAEEAHPAVERRARLLAA